MVAAALVLCLVLIMRLGEPKAPDPAAERPARPGTPYRDAISSIARIYGLTAQEEKVLGFCARGMNARRISEEMVIATNTVKSYMRSLYVKLGVHNQQDLIKLVDAELRSIKVRDVG